MYRVFTPKEYGELLQDFIRFGKDKTLRTST